MGDYAEWQPIASAPRDGTEVRLRGPGYQCRGAWCRVGLIDGWAKVKREGGRYTLWPYPEEWMPSYAPKPKPYPRPSRRPSKAGTDEWSAIYVVGARGQDAVKIGISATPLARLATLQTGFPYDLCLLWVAFGRAPEIRRAERDAHEIFQSRRLRGEWYDVAADEVGATLRGAMRHLLSPRETVAAFDDTSCMREVVAEAKKCLAAGNLAG